MIAWRNRIRWFAAEFLVVVTGVLVALAVQAAYQGGQDRQRERAYLQQLAAELRATGATMAAGDRFTAPGDRAGVMLLRAYRSPTPADSILVWLNSVGRFSFHLPVTGTAEALISSGDLRLIRSDSLRAAITSYVGNHRPNLSTLQSAIDSWQSSLQDLTRVVDLNEAARLMPAYASVKLRDSTYSPLPPQAARSGFAIDPDELLRDRAAYAALDRMNSAKYVARLMRARISIEALALRSLVDAELSR